MSRWYVNESQNLVQHSLFSEIESCFATHLTFLCKKIYSEKNSNEYPTIEKRPHQQKQYSNHMISVGSTKHNTSVIYWYTVKSIFPDMFSPLSIHFCTPIQICWVCTNWGYGLCSLHISYNAHIHMQTTHNGIWTAIQQQKIGAACQWI